MKFRITLMCIFLSIIITSSICAQKVYYWKDEKGVMNVTTTPPPDNIKKYEADSYRKDTKAEIEQYQRQEAQKNRADEAREEAKRRAYQAEEAAKRQQAQQQDQQDQQRRRLSEIQDRRNKIADKLEAAAQGVSPGRRLEALTNAARIRAGLEPLPPSQEPIVDTPPPVDNSPKWGRIYDRKTGKYVEGWVNP